MNSLKTAILALLSAWQWTGRFRQPACRFYPSCSKYMQQAIEKHGIGSGLRLGVVRICKCHPFHDGGVDEVPEVLTRSTSGAMPWIAGAWRGVSAAGYAINVMKSRLKPVFVRTDATIKAQAFCLNVLPASTALRVKQAKTSGNLQDQPSNTSAIA